MESAFKIQMDLQKNTQDLQNYMLDLNNWEEEMKRKELELNHKNPPENSIPSPRNKVKRNKQDNQKTSGKPEKISAYDYNAWEKFDVEKACADLDEGSDDIYKHEQMLIHNEEKIIECNQNESNPNERRITLIDEAFYEKELGNQFVKKEQWNDAITCYTKAISLDSKNPIYYANRSLCFLKLRNFKSAEVDATVAIQLDKNYVKAYQRRAVARLALGQLIESRCDYEEVLRLEPKSALAQAEINKINRKLNGDSKSTKQLSGTATFNPKSIFKFENEDKYKGKVTNYCEPNSLNSYVTKKTNIPQKKAIPPDVVSKKQVILEAEKNKIEKVNCHVSIKSCVASNNVFKQLPEWCRLVQPINLPPHKRSKKTPKRIAIKVIEKHLKDEHSSNEKIIPDVIEKDKTVINHQIKDDLGTKILSFEIPKTSIQFQNHWKIVKQTPKKAYEYLKKIPATQLPRIFENLLESEFFSELVSFLSNDEIKKEPDVVYSLLLGLSNVKRFSSMILFLSAKDKQCLKKCITELGNIRTDEEISNLYRLYEFSVKS